jgi:hypothetical protein
VAFSLIDSLRDYDYVMMDATYDSSEIYEYIFEKFKNVLLLLTPIKEEE